MTVTVYCWPATPPRTQPRSAPVAVQVAGPGEAWAVYRVIGAVDRAVGQAGELGDAGAAGIGGRGDGGPVGAGVVETWKLVIGVPPSLPGGVKVTVAAALPALARTSVGARRGQSTACRSRPSPTVPPRRRPADDGPRQHES